MRREGNQINQHTLSGSSSRQLHTPALKLPGRTLFFSSSVVMWICGALGAAFKTRAAEKRINY